MVRAPPGRGDTHKAQIDCGTGHADVNGAGDETSPFTTSCTFATIGFKTVQVKVTDDDGGYDVESHEILVTYDFDGFYALYARRTPGNEALIQRHGYPTLRARLSFDYLAAAPDDLVAGDLGRLDQEAPVVAGAFDLPPVMPSRRPKSSPPRSAPSITSRKQP